MRDFNVYRRPPQYGRGRLKTVFRRPLCPFAGGTVRVSAADG
ncbi:hypothetical protein [Kingella potus]|nr:hypothetical protein [Kingella potus]